MRHTISVKPIGTYCFRAVYHDHDTGFEVIAYGVDNLDAEKNLFDLLDQMNITLLP